MELQPLALPGIGQHHATAEPRSPKALIAQPPFSGKVKRDASLLWHRASSPHLWVQVFPSVDRGQLHLADIPAA